MVSIHSMGEFGYDLLLSIPYAYWLYKNGQLEKTTSSLDTKPFYYFSPNHMELKENRGRSSGPNFTPSPISLYDKKIDKSKWIAPPYKNIYKNKRFLFDKPLAIIINKYGTKYVGNGRLLPPRNVIDLNTLDIIIPKLEKNHTVVYIRFTGIEFTPDHAVIPPWNDLEHIRKNYSKTLVIQDLHKNNPDLSFNTLQLMLFANCETFISTQGGNASLSSYFGGTNVVYAWDGYEIKNETYKYWHPELSGATIKHVTDYKNLIEEVNKL